MSDAKQRFAFKNNDGYASVDPVAKSKSFGASMINRQP
jgi:hypothetical protein